MSPAQLAMVTVLQFAGNLTDRQAADAVRGRLDWKYCLGLPLDDEGFDFSVLSEFRARLVAAGLERALFDLLLARLKELELVRPGGTARTDSTQVLGAIADLNRLELAGETVRAALEALAAAAPDWLAGLIDASWQEVYGQRIDGMRLPASEAKRTDLASQYGRDGLLLGAVRGPAAPGWLRDLPAVEALRQVWVQQYYRTGRGAVVMREGKPGGQGLPPGRSAIISPYDLDARYSQKRGRGWLGYKIHLTETCAVPEPDGSRGAPNLITSVLTTPASTADVAMTTPVHNMLAAAGLAPAGHAVDAGYASADELVTASARGIILTGPLRATATRQRRTGGCTTEMFDIDWDRQQVTCPQGVTSATWCEHVSSGGHDAIQVKFPQAACRPCPARSQCTTSSRGRRLGLRPRPIHDAAAAARAEQATQAWKRRYNIRAGVEGTHLAGHPRHRHPPRPLPRPGQDQPRAQRRRRRGQPHPLRRLADRQATHPDPDHLPPAAQPHTRRLNQISQQGPPATPIA
jgi:hypothetical protein